MDTPTSNNPLHHHHHHQDQQPWLGFSLSNNTTSPPPPSSSPHHPHLSFFEAFTPSTTPSQGAVVNVDISRDEVEDQRLRHQTTAPGGSSATPVNLSMFVGGSRGVGVGNVAVIDQPQQLNLSRTQFSVEAVAAMSVVSSVPEVAEYDSELKTIAASFLRGFSSSANDQETHSQPLQQQPAPVALPCDYNPKKSLDTFGQRTSIYRGVTRHRWTGRYEAHLWDNSCRREGQSRKGRQVYLGGYDNEDKAARAYDLAALKYWGTNTTTNFPVSDYEKELEDMKHMTRQEFVASLRRKSSGFSRGASIYRGVTRHHQHGRWQARIGRVAGNKDLYLGTFTTQEEAAEAYDIAAIKFRGPNAVTNFDMSRYDVKSIMNSNLPVGGMSGKSKNGSDTTSDSRSGSRSDELDPSSATSLTFSSQAPSSTLNFAIPIKQDNTSSTDCWSNIFGYHHALSKTENQPPTSCSLYQNAPPTVVSYGMECRNPNPTGLFLFNGGYGSFHQHQEENNTASMQQQVIPYATPIGLSSNPSSAAATDNNSQSHNSTMNGNTPIVAPSLHSIQAAKQTLSMFQTPIFGME